MFVMKEHERVEMKILVSFWGVVEDLLNRPGFSDQ
jgi:hypothetical protein